MGARTLQRPFPDGGTWLPETGEDREAILGQLGRLLASPVFMRSKGCSNLLAYVVRRMLEEPLEHLKERTLGTEVFGRPPDYDTATDHVVRSTVADVRKRLAQYYMEPAHVREIRIDVPLGSYVPRFTRPIALPALPPLESQDSVATPVSTPEPGPVPQTAVAPRRRLRLAISVTIAAVAVLATLAISSALMSSSGRTLNGFWQPVLQSPSPILVCISPLGQSAQAASPGASRRGDALTLEELSAGAVRGAGKVYLDDAMALSKLAGWLQQNEKPYRIVPPSRVTFAELQTSPAVLIGFNNFWTTSLADRLRFSVERVGNDVAILRDKKNPTRNDWSVDLTTPFDQPTKDYALVVRALDPKTGQVTVTAAGLSHFGTLAAADFLTDSAQIRQLDAFGPKGWERQNMAIVLSTEVIKGSPGSAKIVAADFWSK